jgi:bla regulator protein blaR1
MKKLVFCTVALMLLLSSAVFAQDITGTWQGTLSAGRDLRTVIKISNDGGTLRAMFYSIDQSPQGLAGNVTVQGPSIKIALPGIGGTYDGKLEDRDTITGTWTQGPKPVPLNLKRATPTTAWAIPEAPAPPKPMAADADPVFEVATIKPARPDAQGFGYRVQGRQFSTINTTLGDLITFAYGIHAKQIVGAPSWVDSEKYDLQAQPEGQGQPNDRQWKTMLQKLIAERFRLKFHRDKKELSVYAIVAEKTPHKLTKNDSNPNGLPGLGFRGLGNLVVRNANMTDFANLLQGTVLDRPVIDQSELPGRWDFTLSWTPDEFQFKGAGARGAPPNPDGSNPPDLFTAFREQLGLKLDSTKAPAEVFVIDGVEKPTAN